MLSFLSKLRRPCARRRRTAWSPETLEPRIVLTNMDPMTSNMDPMISAFVEYGDETEVTIWGFVMDEAPDGLIVYLNGAVAGSTFTDPEGNFSVTADAPTEGDVILTVADAEGAEAIPATVTIASMPPQINSFKFTRYANFWTYEGTVFDESPEGLTVTFGGVAGSHSTTVKADGSFKLTIHWPDAKEGDVTASVTDWYDHDSETAEYYVLLLHP